LESRFFIKALELTKFAFFNHLKLNQLEAHIATENVKSIKLFKKCGFLEEGVFSKYLNLKDKYYDAVVLSLLRSSWCL